MIDLIIAFLFVILNDIERNSTPINVTVMKRCTVIKQRLAETEQTI